VGAESGQIKSNEVEARGKKMCKKVGWERGKNAKRVHVGNHWGGKKGDGYRRKKKHQGHKDAFEVVPTRLKPSPRETPRQSVRLHK